MRNPFFIPLHLTLKYLRVYMIPVEERRRGVSVLVKGYLIMFCGEDILSLYLPR